MSRSSERRRRGWMPWLCFGMIVAVVLGGAGFVYKLIQFTHEALAQEAAHEASFALVPVVVYICVALGFFCLFVWALLRGQFRDVEEPKYRLLEEDERYERCEA